MNLGNQVEWALHCMTVLAGLPEDQRLSAKVLAEFHSVPKEYLSKSLQLLSKQGLVDSSLGPKGGYRLARAASTINLLEIVEAVEGRQNGFRCTEIRKNIPCLHKKFPFSPKCLIAKAMHTADEAWRSSLRGRRLSDITSELNASLDSATKARIGSWLAEQGVAK